MSKEAKKFYRYEPPVSAEQAKRGRGHRIKIASGLYLQQGVVMYLDPALVRGIPHLTEVNQHGQVIGKRWDPPRPDQRIDFPDDPEGTLADAADAVREREAKPGIRSTGKSVFKAGDEEAVKAAMEEANKPKRRKPKAKKADEADGAEAEVAAKPAPKPKKKRPKKAAKPEKT